MKRTFLFSFLYLFFTLLFTFPLIKNLDDSFVYLGDSVLNAYILSWDTHALLTDPLNLFNANTFYPAKLSLTFSEHMLSNILFFGPVYLITKNPIFSLNITILITLFLTGLFTFIYVRYITGNSYAAFISGLIFAFGPPRLAQIWHFQLIAMEWMPLSLYFFEKYISTFKLRHIILFSIAFLLQLCSSYYLAYGFLIISLIYIAIRLIMNRRLIRLTILKNILISLTLAGIIFAWISYPYVLSNDEWGLKRSIDESNVYSADLFSYFTIYQRINIFRGYSFFNAREANHEKVLFPGFICLLLSVIAVKTKNPFKFSLLLGALFAFILSLGPFLQVNNVITKVPLPYMILYKVIPGFSSMRVSARFGLMVFFVLSILSGITIKSINEKITNRIKFLSIFIILVSGILIEYMSYPYPVEKFKFSGNELKAYEWVKKYGTDAVIDFPLKRYHDSQEDVNTFRFMLGSTLHWKPLVNGHSGFIPFTLYEITRHVKVIPDERDLEYLRGIGVTTVILHGEMINQSLPGYSISPFRNTLREVDFGNIKILQMREKSVSFDNKIIKIETPETIPAGKQVIFEGEIEGPFRAIDFRPKINIKLLNRKSGKSEEIKSGIDLPLFIPEGKKHKFGIPLYSPKVGDYRIEFSDEQKNYAFDLERDSLSVVDYLPSSADSPGKLKAKLSIDKKEMHLNPGEEGILGVRTLNKGDAVWLASAPKDYGVVKVGFSIIDKDLKEIGAGRGILGYDIYPGKEANVPLSFKAPINKGRYILKLDMVSEHVTWFEQQGSKPVFLPLIVK